MRLYSLLQIKAVSDAKWAAKNTTLEAKKASPRKDPKVGRATRLDAALAAHSLDRSVDVLQCQEYIRTGHGDPVRLAQLLADKNTRRTDLQTALQARGLHLRDDSRLCEQYIAETYGYGHDISSIVRTMMHMHLAFEHSIVDRLRAEAKADLREDHNMDRDPKYSIGGYDRFYEDKAEYHEA